MVVEAEAQTPLLQFAYHALAGADPRQPALELLTRILTDGDASRLHRVLVEEQKLAISADSYVDRGFDPGLVWFFLSLPAGGDTTQAEAAFDREIERLRDGRRDRARAGARAQPGARRLLARPGDDRRQGAGARPVRGAARRLSKTVRRAARVRKRDSRGHPASSPQTCCGRGNRTVGVLDRCRCSRPAREKVDENARRTLLAACVLFRRACSAAGNGVKVPPFERVQLANGAVAAADGASRRAADRVQRSRARRRRQRSGGRVRAWRACWPGCCEKGAGTRDAVAVRRDGRVGRRADRNRRQHREHLGQRLVPGARSAAHGRAARRHAAAAATRAGAVRHAARASDRVHPRGEGFRSRMRSRRSTARRTCSPRTRTAVPSTAAKRVSPRSSTRTLQRYYQEQVGADRLIVAVAGDFKTAQLKQRISRAFSGWRKAGAALPPMPKAADGRRAAACC